MATRMRATAIILSLQTNSGAHLASYPIRTEDSFPGDKAIEIKKTWIYRYYYIQSPHALHGVVLNYLSAGTYLSDYILLYYFTLN
jgi:hypothetical protein